MVDEFYPTFQEHNITPVVNINSQSLFIHGDGQLLARVFDNLISNAIKYGSKDSPMHIEVLSDDDSVTIKIRNYGSTIKQEDLPHIFDKFYRSDSSRSTSTGGTGLGLAIAKNIVEIHKGQIFARTHSDRTTFVVILPKEPK